MHAHVFLKYTYLYRYIQELISSLYHALINDIGEIHSSLLPVTSSSTTSKDTTSLSTSSLDGLHDAITTPSVLRQQSIEVGVDGGGGVTDLSYNLTDILALPLYNNNSITDTSNTYTPTPVLRKVKIGFLSKFFGIFEPHGLLLDGVMKYLPRHNYEVYALPIARSDSKPLSPSIADAVDYVVEISLSWEYSKVILGQLGLDVLVFADTMSEPMAHFLAHCRYARIQVKTRFMYRIYVYFYY